MKFEEWEKQHMGESAGITANEYQQAALRTANPECRDIVNCALGLCGESGEVADLVKKHTFQGHTLDKEHIQKELGDVAWYMAVMANVLGYSLSDVFEMNVEKLKKRYPDGFNQERSLNRASNDV